MHDDEIVVPDGLVRALVAAQFPHWAGLPVVRLAAGGTVNAIFRIGDDLAARLPLRPADPVAARAALRDEAAAARLLARHSPVPTPVPVALGEPGPGYPLPWSVQTWLPGSTAAEAEDSRASQRAPASEERSAAGSRPFSAVTEPGASVGFARDLAAFVAALRAVDTGGRRFAGSNRGGDLRAHDERVQGWLRDSADLLDVPRLRGLWSRLRDLPRTAPDAMTHGDLIPANVLVADGRLAGVLDGGGFGPADPALDVIAGWHLLDDGPRAVFRAELGCDDLEWERATAWAFEQALGAVHYYAGTLPHMSAMGRRTLRRIVDHTPP